VDWDDLRLVLAVGRHGTLSAAGGALGVVHSTVGRRLSRLEGELGARLFDRGPDGLSPTEAGLDLMSAAEAVEARVARAEGRVRGLDGRLEGPLRVSTLDFLFEACVGVFADFQAAHPGVALTVRCEEAEVSLHRREADVALRLTNRPPETLVGQKVADVRFAIYGHRRLLAQTTDLRRLPWLHWDEQLEPMCRWMDALIAEVAPGAPIALRLGENTLARRAAMTAGLGLHPLPCLEGDRIPELERVGPPQDAFTRGLWLLTLPALRPTRRVRAFFQHVGAALRACPLG